MSTPLRPITTTSWMSSTLRSVLSEVWVAPRLCSTAQRGVKTLLGHSGKQRGGVGVTRRGEVRIRRRVRSCLWRRRRAPFRRRPDEEDEVAVTPTFDIDRSSPTPLYFQLAQALEKAVAEGHLPAGSKLENEVLLAQHYGLSRPTVRRAVQELVDKGLLVRKRGVGTQVIQPHVRRSVELTSL